MTKKKTKVRSKKKNYKKKTNAKKKSVAKKINTNTRTTKNTKTNTNANTNAKKKDNNLPEKVVIAPNGKAPKKETNLEDDKINITINKAQEFKEFESTHAIKITENQPVADLHKNNHITIGEKIVNRITIILLSICKGVLIFGKNIKKWVKSQYNKSRRGKTSSKKMQEEENDELVLLKYRDYHGFAKVSVFFINRIKVIKFDMKRFGKKFKYGTMKDKVLIILMLCLIAGFSAVVGFGVYIIMSAPDITENRLYQQNSSTLLDKDGNIYARLGAENREKVTYDDLPEVLIDAIVATEDSRFFQHNGVDLARFSKAAISQLLGHSDAGGGSTLTMQISKIAFTTNVRSGLAGIVRKFTDVYLSVFVIERKYTKEQIIEFYVNIPNLGAGSYGVEQAAKTYFGKSISEVSLTEAALIAGLFQAPSAYNPYLHPDACEQRRNTVLNLMYRHGYITESERDAAKAIPVTSLLVKDDSEENEYRQYIDTVVEEVIARTDALTPNIKNDGINPYNVGMNIQTNLDPERQKVVNDVMSGKSYKWANDHATAGIAVVSVENGAIVAVGTNRKQGAMLGNNATSARRQPGSTAKPILDYGPAIEYLNWSTGQTIIDDKMTYTGGQSIKNFDNIFKYIMTAKKALAQSRNIPALFTFQQTTNEQKMTFANNLGWTHLGAEENNGIISESAAIGGFDGVTPVEEAAAYATFARGGTYIEPYTVSRIEFVDTGEVIDVVPKKVQAMSDSTAYLINVILKYAVTSGSVGTGSVSGTDIAGKTGTTTLPSSTKKNLGLKNNPIRDSWEVAYSPDYAIATWYGYETIDKNYYLTSSEGSKARKAITKTLVKGIMKKNSRFEKPNSVTSVEIELETDPVELASAYTPSDLRSTEYFKKGTEPTTVSKRFDTLENPSNLQYHATGTQVTLTWDAAPLPDAINNEYLTNYFNNSTVYNLWAEKYLNERLSYNSKNIGSFGYQIYYINSYGHTVDLGFTTSNSFTTNMALTSATKFIVKSSYQKFKSNQSTGLTILVSPNSASSPNVPITPSTQTTEPTTKTNLSVEYIGSSCSTVDTFKKLGNTAKDKIRVKANGETVTDKASVSYTCTDVATDAEINCNNLISGHEYRVRFTVKYNGIERNLNVTLKSSC